MNLIIYTVKVKRFYLKKGCFGTGHIILVRYENLSRA